MDEDSDQGRDLGPEVGRKEKKEGNGSGNLNKKKADVRMSAPLFVVASKGSRIAARMKEEEVKLSSMMGWSYKIVEKSGRTLRELLVKSNVFGGEKCKRDKCGACK